MLSAILAILGIAAAAAGLFALLSQFLPYIVEWMNWAQNFAYELFTFLPEWLVPFAGVLIILSFVSLGVKLL